MAFVQAEHGLSECRACKLLEVDRSSYDYEPWQDRNVELREEWLQLARQKPRYGYRRLHVLLERRGHAVNVKHIYRLYVEEGLSVRRRKRKRVVRIALRNRVCCGRIRSGRWTSSWMDWRQAAWCAS